MLSSGKISSLLLLTVMMNNANGFRQEVLTAQRALAEELDPPEDSEPQEPSGGNKSEEKTEDYKPHDTPSVKKPETVENTRDDEDKPDVYTDSGAALGGAIRSFASGVKRVGGKIKNKIFQSPEKPAPEGQYDEIVKRAGARAQEKLEEKPAEKPEEIGLTIQIPPQKPAGKPVDKLEEPKEKPAQKAAVKPAKKLTGKPAENFAAKPAEKPENQNSGCRECMSSAVFVLAVTIMFSS